MKNKSTAVGLVVCFVAMIAVVGMITFSQYQQKAELEEGQQLAQTGTTSTMDLGDGYEVVYGQLKEVCVHEGDIVSQGDVIGYLSEPTKYYSVEGPNLYFQMLEDGEPVNPLEFMGA